MEHRKLRVGPSIKPDEFEKLTDEQLVRLVPKTDRESFPGKGLRADGHFYLRDATVRSLCRGDLLDE